MVKSQKELFDELRSSMVYDIIGDDKLFSAPVQTNRSGEHYEFLVAAGKDETIHITMTKEAYEYLVNQQVSHQGEN